MAERILGAALADPRSWPKLQHLTDRIGHRLSGSDALDRAIEWAVLELRRDGLAQVRTEPVQVPHWVRGHAHARIVAPIEHELALLALGGSVATAPGGLAAEVVEVDGLAALEALGAGARGRIVLFNLPMREAKDYGSVAKLRSEGASAAARHGAVGMLIRSAGTADFRLPHTGALRYAEDAPKIPAAALSAEDAALIGRLLEAGDTVRVHLDLGCRTLPDTPSANVIAELVGRERPEEIVLIGAHLDSWDVGQGAHDDAAGCAIVMDSIALLQRIGARPRRTIRVVLFTNEENGLRGARDYAARHGGELHVAAIEADSGGFRPVGFAVDAGAGGLDLVRELARPLASLGATEVTGEGGGADLTPLRDMGVPVLNLRHDGGRYFDYHHTVADTLDKVNRPDLERCVAALALMTYRLAEDERTLPRLPPAPPTTP
jgi:Zn-dependent M28 family amino/carboxypeptidase